jgi:hypothetical protein
MTQRGTILAEDEALKAKLSNINVPVPVDSTHPTGKQRAKVWFGLPEQERVKSYPFITIDLLDVVFAADRAHSAQLNAVDYWPSSYPTFAEYAAAQTPPIVFNPAVQYAYAREFHPYNLIYQVATHARSAQHDRAMMATLLGTAYLPDRWGYLQVPADNSERHLIREGFTTDDYYEQVTDSERRRVFRKIYTISVTAEIAPENPFTYYQVLQVHGELVVNGSDIGFEWVNS